MKLKPVEQLEKLHKLYRNKGLLNIGPAWCVVLAVMFSARTKDEQVLKLLPNFFAQFPSLSILAKAPVSKIEATLSSMGMYKQKAKHAKALALILFERYNSQVPRGFKDLVSLPGVGQKTANVVLSTCFDVPAIAVDIHVFRVTNRLGWIKTKTPENSEKKLEQMLPKSTWSWVNQVFVPFGRTICLARKPNCWRCPLKESCLYKTKNLQATSDDLEKAKQIDQKEKERNKMSQEVKKIIAKYVDR